MLAIVYAFKEWRHYLEAPLKTVSVITDHEALTRFMDTKTLARKRQTRWAEYLAAFNFRILWRVGKKNPADGLSRRPDHEEAISQENRQGNMLHELIALRSGSSPESGGRLNCISAVRIAVLTRAQNRKHSRPEASAWNAISGPMAPTGSIAPPVRNNPTVNNASPARNDFVESDTSLTEEPVVGTAPGIKKSTTSLPPESGERADLESQIREVQSFDQFVDART